ncbi:uncharacterized protein LOC144662733 [Oculina patagonica]
MTWLQIILIAVLFRNITSQECGVDTYSIYQQMLKGHIFKTFNARHGSLDCRQACNSDVRCQSYNYVIFRDICELNNRTKEARPEDFVKDKDRYYMRKAPKRVPLGSIPELPADSCKEIKASERGLAVSGNYWLDATRSGDSLLARCDMQTEIADFCFMHPCLNNGKCVNSHVNYTCLCNSAWWTGESCEQAVLPPTVGCVSLTRSEATDSYEVNADHDKPPYFCRVLPEEEINAGDSYTMTVELMNVIGKSGDVNHGHPGVLYNVIDENNFDFVYFRPHSQDQCYQPGYASNGNVHVAWGSAASCPNGSPSGGVWFSVRLEVSSDKSVNVFLNNDLVTSLTAHFDTKGRGGVLGQNGNQNIIEFRNFLLTGTN